MPRAEELRPEASTALGVPGVLLPSAPEGEDVTAVALALLSAAGFDPARVDVVETPFRLGAVRALTRERGRARVLLVYLDREERYGRDPDQTLVLATHPSRRRNGGGSATVNVTYLYGDPGPDGDRGPSKHSPAAFAAAAEFERYLEDPPRGLLSNAEVLALDALADRLRAVGDLARSRSIRDALRAERATRRRYGRTAEALLSGAPDEWALRRLGPR